MSDLTAQSESNYKLSKVLEEKLDRRMFIYGSANQPFVIGKMFDKPLDFDWCKFACDNYVGFDYKYSEGDYLRVCVSSNIYDDNSEGHKLAALSSFYEALLPIFGEADVFYQTNDEEKTMAFQWCFKDREKEIESFKNGTQFDDYLITNLVLLNSSDTEEKKEFLSTYGLPYEIKDLVYANMEEYLNHKYVNNKLENANENSLCLTNKKCH